MQIVDIAVNEGPCMVFGRGYCHILLEYQVGDP